MLHPHRHGQTQFRGGEFTAGEFLQITFQVFFQPHSINTQIAQHFINLFVLMAVMSFLADKSADLLFQYRIGYAIAVIAYRGNEFRFARWKSRRQRTEKNRQQRITGKEKTIFNVAERKLHLTRFNGDVRRGVGDAGAHKKPPAR